MNKIANRAVMCNVLSEYAQKDKMITVLCSDSRGSASMTPFAENFPNQFVEVGIAEQDLVGIAAGMASCGHKSFAISPASFISTRSYEQAKVDCAYSGMNVKLIGISGGVSYGALGMTHHSAQDIAAMTAIPGMRVYFPSDRFQTRKLFEQLVQDNLPAYIRLGRNPVEDVYEETNVPFEMDKATIIGNGDDVLIVACGEMTRQALDAVEILKTNGISATVLDMYCLKPFDSKTLSEKAVNAKLIVTVEEHSVFGGLGSLCALTLAESCPKKQLSISLPDEPVVTGTTAEIFNFYQMNGKGIATRIIKELSR